MLSTVLQVIFLHPAPLHPHIYSNGHICLGMSVDFSVTVFCGLIYGIFRSLVFFSVYILAYPFGTWFCYVLLFVCLFWLLCCGIVSDPDFCCNLLRIFLWSLDIQNYNCVLWILGKSMRLVVYLFKLLQYLIKSIYFVILKG